MGGWAAVPERVVLVATWLVIAVGIALRVRQWASGRAFWLDELLLLSAMRQQRFTELLEPLGYTQSAPPGWLAVQHVLVGVTGGGELGARLLPLLLGCGALVLAALLARMLLGGPAALAATVLVAASTPLILYSAELKQYSSDVFWVLLLLLVGCRVALGRGDPNRGRVALAATAGVGVWFSHAGALVSAGVFAALGILALVRRRPRELAVLAGCATPYVLGLVVEYVTLLGKNADNGVLQDYWAEAFPPDGPLSLAGGWDWFTGRVTAVTANPVGFPHSWPLLVLVAGGLLVLAVRRPPVPLVLLLPVAVVAAAGLAGSYPVSGRLALFVVPLVALVVAAPLDLPRLAARIPRRAVRLPLVAGTVLLALVATARLADQIGPQLSTDRAQWVTPRVQEESRTVLEAVAAERRPGDLVLVDGRSTRFAAAVYGPRLGLGAYSLIFPGLPGLDCAATWLGQDLLRGRYARVWVVTSHTRAVDQLHFRRHLGTFGQVGRQVQAPGAEALRYDRERPPERRASVPPRTCLRTVDPAAVP